LARWLRDRDLQQETTAALNVVENYNGVNDYIHFGKESWRPTAARSRSCPCSASISPSRASAS
jgi:hypothetical protein